MANKKKPLIPKDNLKGFGLDAKESLKWFAQQEEGTRKRDKKMSFHSRPNIGEMYTFSYDPKLKETLPYYDKSPLVFPIKYYKDGFLGMNLHYLPPMLRKKLFEALMKFAVGEDEKRKLKISYQILNGASRAKMFTPTVKRYLNTHVKTQFARVPPDQWSEAIMLPIARFTKASAAKIWSDARSMI